MRPEHLWKQRSEKNKDGSDSWGKEKSCERNSGWSTKQGCLLMWSYKVHRRMQLFSIETREAVVPALPSATPPGDLIQETRNDLLACKGGRFQKKVFQMLTCISGQKRSVEV